MEIKVGDTVELKSGGPVMTVNKLILLDDTITSYDSVEQVECVWFDHENKLPIHHEFVKATLTLYTLDTTPDA